MPKWSITLIAIIRSVMAQCVMWHTMLDAFGTPVMLLSFECWLSPEWILRVNTQNNNDTRQGKLMNKINLFRLVQASSCYS